MAHANSKWLERAMATLPPQSDIHAITAKTAKTIPAATPTPAPCECGRAFCTYCSFCTESEKTADEAWEERAAIIEHEAGIPREWAEAFARVCCMPRPASLSAASWQRVIDHAGRMLDSPSILRNLVRYGWELEDVFSVHPYAPESRQDAKGLLMLMQGAEVVSVINEQAIGLRHEAGGAMLYYRKPLSRTPGRVMIWEMQ